jgi:type IV pilus assembly protein PilQ
VRQRKQIITNLMMGGALAALSATTVNAAQQPSPAAKSTPNKNLIAQADRQPLVPNPKITIDGVPAAPGVGLMTPTVPRAVAPPVGDISVSNLDASIPQLDLGSSAKVNMVLKNTPAREVLESLARTANLNLAYSDSTSSADGKADGKAKADSTVTINLRNEPVQNAFNYVLQLSGLEANRIGNTIFVGTRLPDSVRETIVRTVRLNQVTSTAAANFLATQGAESQIAVNTTTFNNLGTDIAQAGTATGSALSKVVETRSSTIQTLKANTVDSPLILKGLAVSADERLNSITLVGSPRKVQMATALLTRLDARRRQVALNVKIVDVNLRDGNTLNSSVSYQNGDTAVSSNQGAAVLNFGSTPLGSTLSSFTPTVSNVTSKFLASIQTSIASGNGKILTDPTLVVQEGQRSTVNLTQEIVAGLTTTISNTTPPVTTQTYLIKNAGIILDLLVNRIDDNGFVTVNVSPTVSSIGDTFNTGNGNGNISLLKSRTLNSGDIRLRDGQTLILSGIIQESDQTTVAKVPILGDIPLLGALFRSTNKTTNRQEVVVLLTPQILDDNKTQVNYAPGVDARLMLGK